jgi:4-amino-4-deoxy-L-arabinose transferase-like glycosyltransferase
LSPSARWLPFRGTAAVVVLSALYLFPVTQLLHRVGDEGTIAYEAQRVLEGQVPYRDFVEIMAPGSFYWLAMFFKLFGLDWQVTRLYLLFTGVATALLIYFITRRFVRGAASFMPCLFAVVMGLPFWPACNHHWDSNLFALAALICFLKWQDGERFAWLVAAGTLAGVTSCFIQQKGCLLLLAFTITIVAEPRLVGRSTRFRAASYVFAAYASVGASVLLLFYRAGALRDLLYANFTWPLSAYETVNHMPYGTGMADLAIAPCSFLLHVVPVPCAFLIVSLCLLPFVVIVISPLVVIASAMASAWKSHIRKLVLPAPAMTLVLTGLALWLSEIHRSDMIHLLFGSPVLLIAVFVSAEQLSDNGRLKNVLLTAITLGVVLLGSFKLAECWPSYKIETRRGTVLDVTKDDALQFLNSVIAKREWVFVYPYYPMYYYLADVRNPTRFSILMYDYNTAAQFDEVIRDLESKHVKYVLWDTVVDGANLRTWFPAYVQPPQDQLRLERYLQLSYNVVSIKNGFRIMRRNRY